MGYKFETEELNFPFENFCFLGMVSFVDPPRPGARAIKLFFHDLTDTQVMDVPYRVFVPGSPLQLSLMFAGKAGAYRSGEPSRCSTLGQAPDLTLTHKTRLERTAKDKHFRLFGASVNYGRKKAYNIGPEKSLSSLVQPSSSLKRKYLKCTFLWYR